MSNVPLALHKTTYLTTELIHDIDKAMPVIITAPIVCKCISVGCSVKKYFELNLLTFLVKVIANLSTGKDLHALVIILKLLLSTDQLSASVILL